MDKIKVENFMKKLFLCVLALGIIVCSGIIFTGCENLETVALKNGVITHEYTIGDSFDPAGAIIVEKTNKGYKEFYLSYCVYSLEGFDTSRVVDHAKAHIIYKNHVIEFDYSVALNSLGSINTTVSGAVFNQNTQEYDIIYDGLSHDINVTCNEEDVVITKTLLSNNAPFNGAINSGIYRVEIAVSKEGYAAQKQTITLNISRQQFREEDVVYRIYSYNLGANRHNILVGQYKSYGGATYVYNSLSGSYEQSPVVLEYLAQTKPSEDMFLVKAYIQDKYTHEEILAASNESILSLINDSATELGNHTVTITGFKTPVSGYSNYEFTDLPTDLENHIINPSFSFSIVQSSLSESRVTNATVSFEDANASYDSTLKTIVAQTPIEIDGESPLNISYNYYVAGQRDDGHGGTEYYATGESLGNSGVSAEGVYIVTATYTFTHYVSVTLEAVLTIAA